MTRQLSRQQRRLLAYSIPVLSVLAALLIGAVMLILLGADPIEGYREMLTGAFGSGDALTATILKATPLLLVGVGIVIAFRANVINIGAEDPATGTREEVGLLMARVAGGATRA